MWSVDPKLMLLPNGALAVSAGRPGVGLWISSDGSGSLWKYQNLLAVHNGLLGRDQAGLRYDEVMTNVSSMMSPQNPVRQTTGYTGMALAESGADGEAVLAISYDRLGTIVILSRFVALPSR